MSTSWESEQYQSLEQWEISEDRKCHSSSIIEFLIDAQKQESDEHSDERPDSDNIEIFQSFFYDRLENLWSENHRQSERQDKERCPK